MYKGLFIFLMLGIMAFCPEVNAQGFKNIEKELKRMKQELVLSDQQVNQIRLIMEDARAERVDITRAQDEGASKALTRSKLDKINYEERQAITAVLTPKQLKARELLRKKSLSKSKK